MKWQSIPGIDSGRRKKKAVSFEVNVERLSRSTLAEEQVQVFYVCYWRTDRGGKKMGGMRDIHGEVEKIIKIFR